MTRTPEARDGRRGSAVHGTEDQGDEKGAAGSGVIDADLARTGEPAEHQDIDLGYRIHQELVGHQHDAGSQPSAKKEAAQPAQPAPEPPEILFENGKAIIRPHTRTSVAVSTMRLTFQDGTEWDISADIEFAGLSEEDFRVAYDAFLKTQVELGDLRGSPPPLNSKFWRGRGV